LNTLEYARTRHEAFVTEIDRLLESDFPHTYPQKALKVIRELMHQKLDEFKPGYSKPVLSQLCSKNLRLFSIYLPILGVISRSTEVRNAFEIFQPLWRIASSLLDNQTILILSSEWDYVPHVYLDIKETPTLIMIGLPAFEANNPLVIPLAGHELGHPVWRRFGLGKQIHPLLDSAIIRTIKKTKREFKAVHNEVVPNDLRAPSANKYWTAASGWAIRQAEEIFCDFVGLRIFGSSYANAFAYLMAPTQASQRSFEYPNMKKRAMHLKRAAQAYNITSPRKYSEFFTDKIGPSDRKAKYLLSLADSAVDSIIPKLIELADAQLDGKIPRISLSKERMIKKRFLLQVPAERTGGLCNIINAGWAIYNKKGFSAKNGNLDVLFEVILKSLEILEVEENLNDS